MYRDISAVYLPVTLAAVAVIVIALLPLSTFQIRLATLLFIFSVVTIGLNLLMGYAGQISLGHGAFFGIGSYTVAIGVRDYGISPWILSLIALVISGAIAWLIGRPILKLKGYHLAMATLAFGSIFAMVLTNTVTLTGGPDGMALDIPSMKLFGMNASKTWYWLAGGVLVLVMYLLASLLNSPTGRAMRAIHDSEIAADVLGIDVARVKLQAFVISAILSTLAGCCFVMFDRYITPDSSGIIRSIELMAMTVVGGLGSVLGSIVGAAILVVLPQVLTIFHEFEHAIYGLILILIMVFLPKGIVPSLLAAFRRKER